MLPIIDYGSIAVVIPKVSAVGKVVEETKGKFGFEIFFDGQSDAFVVLCDSQTDAEETREHLISIIAEYYFSVEFGPEIDDALDDFDDFDDDTDGHEH